MTVTSQGKDEALKRLVEIVGPEAILTGEATSSYSLDGEEPVAVAVPDDERQIAEIATLANAQGVPVITWGCGTKQSIEPVQPRDGIVLRTTKLTKLDLDAANLTVSVGAGTVVDDLQRELAKSKLFLPLDPADSARSTIGGTLAANVSGPNRLLYRTARDLVLGLRVVTPLGAAIRVGGKTVKDVAGYDLKKLYIGSWGTLGVISEATFRLLPLPEARATVAMLFPAIENGCSTVLELLATFMIPSTADLLSDGALTPPMQTVLKLNSGEYALLVCVEGAVEAVERQKTELAQLAEKNGAREVVTLEGTEELALWQQRKAVFNEIPANRPWMLVKGSVPLKQVLSFADGLRGLEEIQSSLAAHAGNGIVYSLLTVEGGREERLVSAAEKLQRLAAGCNGFVLVQKASRQVADKVRLWPPRNDYGLMRRIKAQLDPNNLWNPARIPGGRA